MGRWLIKQTRSDNIGMYKNNHNTIKTTIYIPYEQKFVCLLSKYHRGIIVD